MTPLLMAARDGHAPIVAALLAAGASAREANGNGTTVLMTAAGVRQRRGGRSAGGAPAPRSTRWTTTNGQTALMFAAARNGSAAITALLAHGANPNVTTTVVPLTRVLVDANGDPLLARGGGAAVGTRRLHRPATPGPRLRRHGHGRDDGAAFRRARRASAGACGRWSRAAPTSTWSRAARRPRRSSRRSSTATSISAAYLLDHGADPTLANIDGLTALYAALDMRWRHNTWYPQPTIDEEKTGYLDFMTRLLDQRRRRECAASRRKLWFRKFRYGDDWVEPIGATTFWRAAQANDVAAMRLLVARGADPQIPTLLGVTPLMVAAGVGFEYQGTNLVPDSRLPAVRYLVEDLHLDVNARDIQHYTPLHGAAYVGENDLVTYLVSKGADPKARAKGRLGGTQGAVDVAEGTGDTVADMANGPREKSLLHPETVKLLESMGAINSHDCRSTACVNNTKDDTKEKPPGR